MGRKNPLSSQAFEPPDEWQNPLLASAWQKNAQIYNDWQAQQKADGIAKGLIDPQTGWPTQKALVDAAQQYGAAMIGSTSAPGEGAGIYHRFTNGGVDNGAGFMMYADKASNVDHYGPNHYEMDISKIDPKQVVDASSDEFQSKLAASLDEHPDALESLQRSDVSAEDVAAEAAPKDINDSAGFWDNQDLVSHAWEHVMEPNGWTVVRTPDGAISFDPAHAQLTPYDGR